MNLIQSPGVLNYANNRYLKLSGSIVLLAVIAYVLLEPKTTEPYGGTVLGYVLGIVSTVLIFILFWYGFNKRCPAISPERRNTEKNDRRAYAGYEEQQKYASLRKKKERRVHRPGQTWRHGQTLQGWLSAHIYLGASLIVLATLHTGFRFGWNVHTLAYVLTMVVVFSGFYGLYLYLNYPRQITQSLGEDTLDELLLQIAELDELARIRALDLPDDVNHLILQSRIETRIGGTLLQQLIGRQRNCPTEFAVQQLQSMGDKYIKDEQPKFLRELYALMLRKVKLLNRARMVVMLKARLDAWLYLHVPFSVALLTALLAHVLAIIFYW